ncbi:hypothetical protein [Planococcus salinus]|uniref:Lipoprotein n=1 Tax=Planococcus salinus TaxID=1848460 RepID=A0A3M8P4C7_9BACL|nr:hypothetical protein [Planococcus salinus]RNF38513.1 hypothetical protein EEX84_14345 [Planococcus salinus]
MKKNLLFAASLLAVSGFMAACGTSDTAEEPTETTDTSEETADTAPEDTVEEALEEEVAEDVPAEEAVEEETEDSGSGTDATEDSPEEASGDVSEAVETEGTLTQSDEQAYELYVLPGYELTSEEPNKDSLYVAEDDSVFMRIETFTTEQLDFASAEETMKQTLNAVNPDAEAVEGQPLENSAVTNSSVYEVDSTEGTVTGITFEKEDLIVRLTIFDNEELNATEDFKRMGQTIERTE